MNGQDRNSLKELIRPVVINDKLVRVGGKGDGAYIIPEGILPQCDVCYSYGISDNIDFTVAPSTGSPARACTCTISAWMPRRTCRTS